MPSASPRADEILLLGMFDATTAAVFSAARAALRQLRGDRVTMIELGLGALAIFSAAAIAFGLLQGLVPFPLGSGAVITLLIFGLSLMLRGAYRLVRKRGHVAPHTLRSIGLMGVISGVTIILALAMPSLSEPLNLVTVGGFPLGVYFMAQGTLILFVILLFVFAVRQNRIDDAGEP